MDEIDNIKEKLIHGDYYTGYFPELEKVFIGKGTPGPEVCWSAQYFTEYLIENDDVYKGKTVLEIGAGSGIQTVVMAGSADSVLAADISEDAIRSIEMNIEIFNLRNVDCVKSDLFDDIPDERYDVIVFVHPFVRGSPEDMIERIYMTEDENMERFFVDARHYLAENGIILMPFSHFCDHNPVNYGNRHGYAVKELESITDCLGKHSIYLLEDKPPQPTGHPCGKPL